MNRRIVSATLCWLLVSVSPLSGFAAHAAAQVVRASQDAVPSADLARSQTAAIEAIESGAHKGAALVPLYTMLAIASARLHDEEGARHAFTVLLALDPSFRLSKSAPEEVRSSYMEAKGFWSAHETHLAATAELTDDHAGVLVRVTDQRF